MELKEKQLAEDSQRNEQVHKEREELMKKELEEARNSVTAMQRLVQSSEVQKINNKTELRTRREIYTYIHTYSLSFLGVFFFFCGHRRTSCSSFRPKATKKMRPKNPSSSFCRENSSGHSSVSDL